MQLEIEAIPPHQTAFINSKKRYVLNSGGVGSGKTYSIVLKTLVLCGEYPGIFCLIGAQTYSMLRDTTLREFLNVCPPGIIQSFNKTNLHMILKNKSEIIFRSFDDPNKLKSLNLGACGIEEMTDVSEEIFKMLRTRMRQDKMPGCIYGATNPGTFGNWVYKYFIESPIDNSEVIYSITADNFFLPEEYLKDLETLRRTNPEYYERMVKGRWGALEGLIYNLTGSQREAVKRETKKYHRVIAGLDFGYTHPTAFIIIGIIEDEYTVIDEVYRHKMTSSDIVKAVKEKVDEYDIECIYCDSARPEIIDDLQRAGLPAFESIKDVFDGIMYVKGLIGDGKLSVCADCTYTLREFDSYIWDAKNTIKEVPLKINDDCFTGKHKVLTLRGMVKLKNIKIDDLIYTRDGFKKILKLYCSDKEVREYKTCNHVFECTDNHPFFSLHDNQFKSISLLTEKDILYTLNNEEYLKCKKQKLSSLMESSLDAGLSQGIEIIKSISPATATILKKVLGFCIVKSGNFIMEKFQKVAISIIKTVIRLITQLKILSVSTELIISRSTLKSGIKKIKSKAMIILTQLGIWLLSGISQKKVTIGTFSMVKMFLEKSIPLFANVYYAEWIIKQYQQKKEHQNFVQIIVNLPSEENQKSTIWNLRVGSAVKSFILTNTENRFTAQRAVRVKHIGKNTEIKKTYNLTVEGTPEYFIDGVLVHNCLDGLRYSLYTDYKKSIAYNCESIDFGDDRTKYDF